MFRPGMEVVAMMVLVESLSVGPMKAGQSHGSGAGTPDVRAASAPKPEFSVRDGRATSFPSLAAGAAPYAAGGAVIQSQPPEFKLRRPRRTPLLIALYASNAVLQGLDAQSTLRALHSGTAREGNPLVSPFASHPAALISLKTGLAAGTIFGIDRLYRSHPRLAMITLAAIDGGYVYLVQRNYRSFPAH